MNRSDLRKLDEHIRNADASIRKLDDVAVRLQLETAVTRFKDPRDYLAALGLRSMVCDVMHYTHAAVEALGVNKEPK